MGAMNALPVILVVGATLPMVLWMIWSAIKATRTPPRNKRVNLPPPQAAALSRRYADT